MRKIVYVRNTEIRNTTQYVILPFPNVTFQHKFVFLRQTVLPAGRALIPTRRAELGQDVEEHDDCHEDKRQDEDLVDKGQTFWEGVAPILDPEI